jgi:nicotinate-nucleotide adenylyltransferase
MKVGLFFGSFNPIHVGHMIIANYMVEFTNLDEVWFVVTPHNPFKKKKTLLHDNHRYQTVMVATEDYVKLRPSRIEFDLPQPNYTIDTLTHLYENYPQHDFSLIMGEDNLNSFHKWKNYEMILENHNIYVYPRISETRKKSKFHGHLKVNFVDAPIVEISSTFIRTAIHNNKDIRSFLPSNVWKYIDEMNFYK